MLRIYCAKWRPNWMGPSLSHNGTTDLIETSRNLYQRDHFFVLPKPREPTSWSLKSQSMPRSTRSTSRFAGLLSDSHRVSWSISSVCFTQIDDSGSPPEGAASLGRAATTRDLGRFAFSSACHEEMSRSLISARRTAFSRFGLRLPHGICSDLLSLWINVVPSGWRRRRNVPSKCEKVG